MDYNIIISSNISRRTFLMGTCKIVLGTIALSSGLVLSGCGQTGIGSTGHYIYY